MSINQLRDLTPANAVLVANELTGSSKDNWLKAVLEKQIKLSTSELIAIIRASYSSQIGTYVNKSIA